MWFRAEVLHQRGQLRHSLGTTLEDVKTYRFNPFDLTKVWPYSDYPLHEVGRLTLDRSPTDLRTEIEPAAFEPNNLVPGIGVSPDKMLLGRLFAYADAHSVVVGGGGLARPFLRGCAPSDVLRESANLLWAQRGLSGIAGMV